MAFTTMSAKSVPDLKKDLAVKSDSARSRSAMMALWLWRKFFTMIDLAEARLENCSAHLPMAASSSVISSQVAMTAGRAPFALHSALGQWNQHARACPDGARLVLLTALLLVLALLLGRGVLVLLVLGDEVVHVGLGLGELHLVHAL